MSDARESSHLCWVAVLALLGGCLSAYLALYQLGLTSSVWDPLFGATSSEAVLRSAFSRSLPLPDAAVGAATYLAEALLALLSRDRTWALLALAALLIGLALTGLVLVSMQLLVIHAACTLCIGSAVISFINLALGHADLAASARVLRQFGGLRNEAI
jgi:uncharacterized membrane protein